MDTIKLTIDNREVEVPKGTTVLSAAKKLGISIPTLCHQLVLPNVCPTWWFAQIQCALSTLAELCLNLCSATIQTIVCSAQRVANASYKHWLSASEYVAILSLAQTTNNQATKSKFLHQSFAT